jgi:hypothetical protein
MKPRWIVVASATFATSCGGSLLELGPQGWRVPEAKYTIAPVEGNRVMPDGWRITNYEKTGSGQFEKQSTDDTRDLELRRTSDDGIAVIATEVLPVSDYEKSDQTLAERFARTVSGAGESDDATSDARKKIEEDFAAAAKLKDIVSKVRLRAIGPRAGVASATISTPQQYSIRVLRNDSFDLPGGHGCEIEIERTPTGASDPDRKFYAALLRPRRGPQFIGLVYGDSPSTFGDGAAQVAALARRFRLQ